MNPKAVFTTLFLCLMILAVSCQAQGLQLGKPSTGQIIDKSGDTALSSLVAGVLPKFRSLEYKTDNISMPYSLFIPDKLEKGKKYPLVMFMADASTTGMDVKAPLKQGYGALVWATDEAQAKNPCFVLVPQFSGVAVNDLYQRTPEVDETLKLLKSVVANYPIDPARLYATGQSMGGMISMYYNINYPNIFAASLFVDCHWDIANFGELVRHPFIMIYAGDKGKSYPCVKAIEDVCRAEGIDYAWSEWSAKLPLATQDDLARTMLDKGRPVNLFGFENGSVLPDTDMGSEHMYSFDHAYMLTPPREWLFTHKLAQPGIGSL